jgi:hypothetical protein
VTFKHYLHEFEASNSLSFFVWIVPGPCQISGYFPVNIFDRITLQFAALSSVFVAK